MNIDVVYENVPKNNKYYIVQGETVKFHVSHGVKTEIVYAKQSEAEFFFNKNWKLRL